MYFLKFKARANFGRHAAVFETFMYQILWHMHIFHNEPDAKYRPCIASVERSQRQILWAVRVLNVIVKQSACNYTEFTKNGPSHLHIHMVLCPKMLLIEVKRASNVF